MKTLNKFLFLLPLAVFALACNLISSLTPSSPTSTSELPAGVTDVPTAIPVLPTDTVIATGRIVTLNRVSITIPQGLAVDALAEMVPASTDPNAPPWKIVPAHMKFTLTSYQLQDKFHKPQIYIIPAQGYISSSPGADESISRLVAILRNNVPAAPDNLPFIPFFNAGQIFAAQIKTIQFQGGSGVRFLTEYTQYFASANNVDLFYHFQGLMDDHEYYIIAILPVTASILAADESPDSPVPAGGVPFPGYDDPNADFAAYYDAVTQKLNAAAPQNFTPPLDTLDALIQSITVNP